MVKANNYLLLFGTVFLVLAAGVAIASHKFIPLLWLHTVYYCHSLVSTISPRLPQTSGSFLAGLLFLLFIYSLSKFFLTFMRVQQVRKKLISRIKSQAGFNRLTNKLKLNGKVFLVAGDKPFAFCFGIRHPKIYLSTAMFVLMNSRELAAILLHEKYHLEHRDGFTMLLAETAKSLFPFFPLLSDILKNYRIEREIKADRAAILELGKSQSLVSVLQKLLSFESLPEVALTPAIADHDTLEYRIKALVRKEYPLKKYSFLNIVLSVLSVGVLSGLVIVPVQAVELHEQGTDVMMVCLKNDACTSWCKENNTIVPYSRAPNASHSHTPAP